MILCKKQMIFFESSHLVLFSLRQYLEQQNPERRDEEINVLSHVRVYEDKQARKFFTIQVWRA